MKTYLKHLTGLAISFLSISVFAAPIEGYWKSIDDRTSEQLAIVEIKQAADGTYRGKRFIFIQMPEVVKHLLIV